jgi:transcriptional regulator
MSGYIFTDTEMHQIKVMRECGHSDNKIASILDVADANELKEIFKQTEAVNEGIYKNPKTANEVDKASNNAKTAA